MRAPIFLRMASIIMFLYCAGHTSGYPWIPVEGETEIAITESMKSHEFDVIGSMRSFWDFYIGFGLVISGFMLAIAVVIWQTGSMAKQGVNVRPIIITLFIAFVINTILSFQFFFVIPTTMAAIISTLLGVAFMVTPRAGT